MIFFSKKYSEGNVRQVPISERHLFQFCCKHFFLVSRLAKGLPKTQKKAKQKTVIRGSLFCFAVSFLFLIYKAAQRDLNFINCLNESSD